MSIVKTCAVCNKSFTSRQACCSKNCGYIYRNRNAVSKRSVEERFWAYVDKSGGPDACWIWTAQIATNGYGVFSINHKPISAHRAAFELTYGSIPDGLYVLHTCPGGVDHRNCVNPQHIRAGTAKDNMDDRSARGTKFSTRNKTGLKLDESSVAEIRSLYAGGGYTYRELAAMFGCALTTISDTVKRRNWAT